MQAKASIFAKFSLSQHHSSLLPAITLHCNDHFKMYAFRFAMTVFLLAFILAAIMFGASDAAYRKPPFNGSIFGKRSNIGKSKLLLRLRFLSSFVFSFRVRHIEGFLGFVRGGFGDLPELLSPERQQVKDQKGGRRRSDRHRTRTH